MTLKRYNGSNFELEPFRYYDGTNWRGTPMYRYSGTEWVDVFLNDGLVAYYPFDGNVLDYSGNNNDATDNTSAGYGTARIGSDSKEFDGVDDYVDTGIIWSNIGSAWSLSTWILFDSIDDGEINSIINVFDGTDQIFIDKNSGNWLIGSNDSENIDTPISTAQGSWLHLAVTYDGSTLRGYENGTEFGSVTDSTIPAPSTYPIYLGAYNTEGSAQRYFDGLLDSARLFDRGLSNSEVNHLYQHGRVI